MKTVHWSERLFGIKLPLLIFLFELFGRFTSLEIFSDLAVLFEVLPILSPRLNPILEVQGSSRSCESPPPNVIPFQQYSLKAWFVIASKEAGLGLEDSDALDGDGL